MKRAGHGGAVLIDGETVAQVTSWSYTESPGSRAQQNATDTNGSLDLIFYEGFSLHILPLGKIVEIQVKPAASATENLTIQKARITGRSVDSNPTSIVGGSIDFISRYAVVYP